MTKWEYRIVEETKGDGSVVFTPENNHGIGWEEIGFYSFPTMKEAQRVIDERIASRAANVVVKRVEHPRPDVPVPKEKKSFWDFLRWENSRRHER